MVLTAALLMYMPPAGADYEGEENYYDEEYEVAEPIADYEPIFDLNGGTMYVYLPSVNADEYNPPFYQISADTVYIDKNLRETKRNTVFRYNYDKQTVYLKAVDGKWYWLDAAESEISAKELQLAEWLFFRCYNTPFGK